MSGRHFHFLLRSTRAGKQPYGVTRIIRSANPKNEHMASCLLLAACYCQETLASVKKAFNSLSFTANKQILLCAHFQEFNDVLQITEELWPDLLPKLMLVQVVLDRACQASGVYIRSGIRSKYIGFVALPRMIDNIRKCSFCEDIEWKNDHHRNSCRRYDR